MNNSETDISGQNPNLARRSSTFRRFFFLPIKLLKTGPRLRKSRNGACKKFWEIDRDGALNCLERRVSSSSHGFYLRREKTAEPKQPFAIAMKDGRPFTFASLWATNRSFATGAVGSPTRLINTRPASKGLHYKRVRR